ncbi:TRAP transporter small permease subunit [Chloroflexota bacterium]
MRFREIALKILRALYRGNIATIIGLNFVAAGFTVIVMVLMNADVVMRKFFNDPIPGVQEISISMVVFVFFLAFARAMAHGAHIRIQVLTKHFNPNTQVALDILACVAGLLYFGLLAWLSSDWAWRSLQVNETMEGPVQFPYWPSKFAVTLGSIFLCTQYLQDLVRNMNRLLTRRA